MKLVIAEKPSVAMALAKGIPKEEIAFIHEATSDKQKEELFSKVRKGEIRILMGSTQKMGAGTNVQNKLIALHDLDVPWRPADLEQRAGRIVRQGNENKEVRIFRYVTENTFDAYLWQTIENKQKFISQIMTSKTPVRVAEDVDESSLNYAEIKALATGNPLIKEKMDLDNEVTKLKMLEANFKSNRYRLEDKVAKTYPQEIHRLETQIEAVRQDQQLAEPQGAGENRFTFLVLGSKIYHDKKEAGEALLEALKGVSTQKDQVIGQYRNFTLEASYDVFSNEHRFCLRGEAPHYGSFGTSVDGNILRMDNVIDKMAEQEVMLKEKLQATRDALQNAKEELQKPFDKAEELQDKVLRLAELNKLLDMGEVEELKNPSPLLEDVKRAIIEFRNREYDENNTVDMFDTLYPDLKHVGLAYTETEDGRHSIQYELNLEDKTWTQYVDEVAVAVESFAREGEEQIDPLRNMKDEIELSDFSDLVYIEESQLNDLIRRIENARLVEDPLAKDMDNDGIPDRNDNAFQDSDYLESTYDVDERIKEPETMEKPSILQQIADFKAEEQDKPSGGRSKEQER